MPSLRIGPVDVTYDPITGIVTWTSGMEIDADGAPNAYNPADTGIDRNANAGLPGTGYGLALDAEGHPCVQGSSDPFPGYYVARSALEDLSYPVSSPARYVDATRVCYISVPLQLRKITGMRLGDLGVARLRDRRAPFIVAESGPAGKLGEGSIALSMALGLDPQRARPHHRLVGIDSGVGFRVFSGTRTVPAWPRADIDEAVAALEARCG